VFQACRLNRRIGNGLFDNKYHIIGDGAFPLSVYLMKPFIGDNLTENNEHFNYRLSRARMVVECAFGRLKGRWRVLLKRCDTYFEKTVKIIRTCCILHNICENSNELFHHDWMDEVNELA
jgi:DDE superfamily endonuclease